MKRVQDGIDDPQPDDDPQPQDYCFGWVLFFADGSYVHSNDAALFTTPEQAMKAMYEEMIQEKLKRGRGCKVRFAGVTVIGRVGPYYFEPDR